LVVSQAKKQQPKQQLEIHHPVRKRRNRTKQMTREKRHPEETVRWKGKPDLQ
jgi:hypothetical protein